MTGVPDPTGSGLLEREGVVGLLHDALGAARDGAGRTVVVEAGAGLGKTSVLALAAGAARAAGMEVLTAQGGELEQEMPWAVTRQLLARATSPLAGSLLPAATAALGLQTAHGGDDLAVMHALTDTCAELARAAPIFIAVDDAQWADAVSVRWLAFLARRAAQLPVALALATRPRDPRAPAELTALTGRDDVLVATLAPLSRAGSLVIARDALGDTDPELCDACADASGGNPFLLIELTRELAAAPDALTEIGADTLAAVPLARVDRAVARRLLAAGEEATGLARVLSVFGSRALVADVAAVAGLAADASQRAADALRAGDVIADVAPGTIAFAHPLLRSAMERTVPPGERSVLHVAAARHLWRQREDVAVVGAHLLNVEPGGDRWVRDRLVEAGDAALAAGAPANAVNCYERAIAERTGPPEVNVLTKLGRAAMGFDPAAAEAPLLRAFEATTDPVERVPIALDLAMVWQTVRRTDRTVPLLDRLVAELEAVGAPAGPRLRLQAELLAQSFFDSRARHLRRERLPAILSTLTGAHEEEALILVQEAIDAINFGTAAETRALADRAWAGGRLVSIGGSPVSPAVQWLPYFYLYIDDYDTAARIGNDWLRQAQAGGSSVLTVFASTLLAEADWRAGRLRAAIAVAETAWNIARQLGRSFPGWWIAISSLAQSLIAVGQADSATDLLARHQILDGPPPDMMLLPLPRAVRAETLIAAGRVDQGVQELLGTLTWVMADQHEPSPGAWRFQATLVDGLLALSRRAEAADIAAEWLAATTRFGTASTLGMAQRAAALAATGEAQLQGLAQAEQTLSASPAKVEHARALLELGAALRRAGQRTNAMDPLRRSLDLASRCGASPLASRARAELAAAGARPRRDHVTGVGALSPSELRVAQLAATGLTNRDIGAALFISRKTVERHLSAIYTKLGTSDRAELPELLAAAAQ